MKQVEQPEILQACPVARRLLYFLFTTTTATRITILPNPFTSEGDPNMDRSERPEVQSWNILRLDALGPGGYDDLDGTGSGTRRQVTWLRLLDASGFSEAPSPACSSRPAHPDERQVQLDVARSLTWKLGLSPEQREARRAQLHEVVVCTLRTYPQLA